MYMYVALVSGVHTAHGWMEAHSRRVMAGDRMYDGCQDARTYSLHVCGYYVLTRFMKHVVWVRPCLLVLLLLHWGETIMGPAMHFWRVQALPPCMKWQILIEGRVHGGGAGLPSLSWVHLCPPTMLPACCIYRSLPAACLPACCMHR